ncbi:MAG: hypothetical protein ACT4P7_05575 [Gemmatimonadaceae bacterium]
MTFGSLSIACATTRVPASDVPPLTVAFGLSPDSARTLLLEAMRTERVAVEGDGQNSGSVVTTSYTVRRGGMGESLIRLRFVIEPDDAGASLILLEAIATDRVRGPTVGDRTSAAQRAEAREVPANDLEALRPVQRILRRLEALGGLVTRSP